jgi:hypothetical protein
MLIRLLVLCLNHTDIIYIYGGRGFVMMHSKMFGLRMQLILS